MSCILLEMQDYTVHITNLSSFDFSKPKERRNDLCVIGGDTFFFFLIFSMDS